MLFLPRTFPLLPSAKEESETGEFFHGQGRIEALAPAPLRLSG